jgi:outer membrane protein assembly factor BamD
VTPSLRPTLALLLLAALAAFAWGCGAGTIPAVHSEPERLSLARRMMEQHRWASATELFKSYIQNNPGSVEVDEAVYQLGICYLHQKDWALAATEFERMSRDYPESDSTPSASFRLGEALYAQARPPDFDQEYTNKAIEQWKTYLRDHPGHWLNPEAERQEMIARSRLATKLIATGDLYLKLNLPGPARVYYQRVIDDYGDTLLLGRALLGRARCDAKQHENEQAIETLRQVEQRFAGQPVAVEAARERSRIERRLKP